MIFNSTIISNGGGLYASIFATGVAQEDTVTLTTPSGKVKSGKWATKDSADGILFEKLGEYGTYTLTAIRSTDGKTDNKSVVVDTAAEYKVSEFYRLYLYKSGDECEDITGGWFKTQISGYDSKVSLAKNADNMLFHVDDAYYFGVLSPNNKIDFTNHKKLHIDGYFQFVKSYEGGAATDTFVYAAKASGSNANVNVFSISDNSLIITNLLTEIPWNGSAMPTHAIIGINQTLTEIEYDVSNVTGSFYLWLRGYCGVINMTYRNIWLE